MTRFQEAFEHAVAQIAKDTYVEGSSDAVEERIAKMVPEVAEETAKSMLTTIKRHAPSALKEIRKERREFEERLGKQWQRPLDLLDLFISIATESGDDFNCKFRNDAADSNDAVFKSLTIMHARACQISSAILLLLRSGYADDAHARWRSLHEIAVVGHFIRQNGQDMAERYLHHDTIQRYKLALSHQKYAERINDEPMSQEELNKLKAKRDQLVERFGDSFKEDYGWAASVLRTGHSTLVDIEQHVGLEHWRPYYRMASDNVHANAHGAYFRLGLGPETNALLLVGPSSMGLVDAGHSSAISLRQITVALLATRPTLDGIVASNILSMLQDEIGQAFLEVHHELEGSNKTL